MTTPDLADSQPALASVRDAFAQGHHQDCLDRSKRLLARHPELAEGWMFAGGALAMLGRHMGAATILGRMRTLSLTETRHWRLLRDSEYQLGRLGRCGETCRQLILRDPSDFGSVRMLARVSAARDVTEQAVVYLFWARVLRPTDQSLPIAIGRACFAMGRLVEAERWNRRAALVHPSTPERWFDLGRSLRARGAIDDSETASRRATMIDPRFALFSRVLRLTVMKSDFQPSTGPASERR